VSSAQLLAGVDAAVLPTQPLAVQEPAARELDRRAAAGEPLDRFEVEGFVLAQQRTAARFDPERPFGAARPRAFAQPGERRGLPWLPVAADGGLDQLDQGPAVRDNVLVLAGPPGGSERLAVVALTVVQQRVQPRGQAERGPVPRRPANIADAIASR